MKDKRLRTESVLVIIAFLSNLFFGKTLVTQWFGWWLFLIAIINLPAIMWGAALIHQYGKEYCEKKFTDMMRQRASYEMPLLILNYSFYLYFWWKWL